MPLSLRLTGLSSLVVGLFAGALWLAPARLLADLGLDWRVLSEAQRRQVAESERAETLRRGDALVLKRMQDRKEVIRRLLAGQLTLRQAAVRFRHLNNTPAELAIDVRRSYPAPSEGESLCRQVISCAEAELSAQGATDFGPVQRLRTELDDMLRLSGTVEFPQE
jgi:hypothetical protein